MGNDVTWWKDRDQWMPDGDNPPPRLDSEEEHRVADEDIGDIADDRPEDVDDVEPPQRGPDS